MASVLTIKQLQEPLISNRNHWDAKTYDEVSRLVQYRWGQQVLRWRKWSGDEIVMDAGCGSGLLTKLLARKVPRGRVYAVDIDSNMIEQARIKVKRLENVEVVLSDFADVELPTKLDVIFSNASLHWVNDHAKVFRHFWEILKSNGIGKSQLLIQCGGYGNLHSILTLLRRVTQLKQFEEYFRNMSDPWYFAKPDDTIKLLRDLGYVNIKVHLKNDRVILPSPKIYSRFVKTVIMKPFLEQLSDFKTRDKFLESFLDEVEKKRSTSIVKKSPPWSLDYVRLNIIADNCRVK